MQTIERLTEVHEQLLSISKNKTDAIKESDSEALVKLLTKERQLIQKVEQLETLREQLVEQHFKQANVTSDEKTFTVLLATLDDGIEKVRLEKSVANLIQLIVAIRESEQLNNELLQQSMQFLQLSLDMIQPDSQNIHYGSHAKGGNEAKRRESTQKRSVFDSKV